MKENKFYQIADFYPFLKCPEKYTGKRPITLRSGWEISFAQYLDKNQNVVEWSSETTVIKYIRPDDKKPHRYFMDFTFVALTSTGKKKTFWVEIKPQAQKDPPKVPRRKTRAYFDRVRTYLINQAKWETTRHIVEEKKKLGQDIEFLVLTEKDCKFFIK